MTHFQPHTDDTLLTQGHQKVVCKPLRVSAFKGGERDPRWALLKLNRILPNRHSWNNQAAAAAAKLKYSAYAVWENDALCTGGETASYAAHNICSWSCMTKFGAGHDITENGRRSATCLMPGSRGKGIWAPLLTERSVAQRHTGWVAAYGHLMFAKDVWFLL